MKKLFILLTGVIAAGAAALAGCGVKNSEETFEPQPEPRTITQEENGENEQKPDCGDDCKKKMPRVILKRGHGNAVGFFGGISDGKFFFIRFGDGESGDFEIYPDPLPVPLPDEQPIN